MEANETPAGSVEAPAVFAEYGNKNLPVPFRGRLGRSRADLRRIVADVVIAGQVTAGSRNPIVQRFGEFEIIAIGRAVESEVTGVDDQIGTPRVDVFAYPIEVVGQCRQAAGKMGVGNLDQAKFGHAIFLGTTMVVIIRQRVARGRAR